MLQDCSLGRNLVEYDDTSQSKQLNGLMTSALDLVHVTKTYDDAVAVRDVSVSIAKGEFFSFLGPSGCGKTTILRMISGFIAPTQGEIRLDGKDLAGVGPHKRATALIFQNLALFPLMSVADNIAYGLRVRGATAAAQRRKADELLDLIALSGYGDKRIDELSGGQKQRVAIARALAVQPAVLLLDEPLSSLDLKLRQHMRAELRSLQKRTGVTFVYITHDQGEALAMSDRVAVMSNGQIEQIGTSTEIYNHPATSFVASLRRREQRLRGTRERYGERHGGARQRVRPVARAQSARHCHRHAGAALHATGALPHRWPRSCRRSERHRG